ncbi:3-galactosyl-N-acetylglucosaminide 4-alpha-L-fucosyltransferase FUT3-like [Macrobrachium rosenbergii]|uniref:3-galactosyl-N-acetylglucosaminide 4-alpha-L-fucosyltransferase FUT3-like n=1 Tax=Macrobrachium rosenbergii TaxID=79674 RepID=UPI0034D58746
MKSLTSEWNWWPVRSRKLMYGVLMFLVIFLVYFLENFHTATLLIWKKFLVIPPTPENRTWPTLLETANHSIIYPRNSPYTKNWRNFTQREIRSLSVLGRRLYLEEDVGSEQKRNFIILAWKQTEGDEEKFIREFGEEKLDPFRLCSVKNCKLVTKNFYSRKADAIIFHLHRTKKASTYPRRANFNQRWIWLTEESPYHTLYFAEDKDFSHYNGIFNWSMSYRMNSDVPMPFGRTVRMTDKETSKYEKVDYFNIKTKLAASMMSNCDAKNNRAEYANQLQQYIDIDIYGPCFKTKWCRGHHNRDCVLLHEYKFFLAFENSNCKEYITEKVWWQSFQKGAIPVVMGAKIEDYRKFLPPNSFIHVDEFQSPYHLAKYLMYLEYNRAAFMEYHAWRSHFKVLNEHGNHGSHSYHYCRVCEALNYNDPTPKVYNHMELTVNEDTQCYPATRSPDERIPVTMDRSELRKNRYFNSN